MTSLASIPGPRGRIIAMAAAILAVALSGEPATASLSGGFLYRDGRYTALDSVAGQLTGDAAVNDRGQTTGSYAADGTTIRGFIRDTRGRYTGFDAAPGATTDALGINDQGAVAGVYGVTEAHGFVRAPDGKVTTIDVPGALGTYLFDINDRGAVVGDYVDAHGLEHGFLRERGTVTTIDPPGAPAGPAARDTAATGINDRGQVAGQYVDAASVLHGYLWQPERGFMTVDPPRIISFNRGFPGAGTVAADINDQGQILLPAAGTLYKARAVPASG